jgi:L-aminopeptidase/D-esterase-like protein
MKQTLFECFIMGMDMALNGTLTDVPGIRVGHATNLEAATGCTVIACPPNTIGGVDVRGGAPGTRETDLLNPHNHVEQVSAVVLSGGSAYGLATADGVMRYLAEQGQGYRTSSGYLVPIVPAAILFDLGIGTLGVYPDAAMGYAACQAATADPVAQGTVGAGTGAVCGAMLGKAFATKGGLGSASIEVRPGLIVAALVAVNAVGDITDEQGQIIAGLRTPPDGNTFTGMLNALRQFQPAAPAPSAPDARENTVIGVIATNAKLSKAHINKVAQMAHDGIARAVNPAHTMYDGDTLFALATGEVEADATVIGAFAAEAMAQAIRNGIRAATSLDGVRAWNE